MKYLITILSGVLLSTHSIICSADTWLNPKLLSTISDNGKYVVRVSPSTEEKDVALSDSNDGNAEAKWFRFDGDKYRFLNSTELSNPVNPVYVLVSDRGYLVTLDNWHSLGFGNVVSIYTQSGFLIADYKLTDIYDLETVSKFNKSASSIRWRCELASSEFIENHSNILKIFDSLGGLLSFDLFSGDFEYEADVYKNTVNKDRCKL